MSVASPTERADKVRECLQRRALNPASEHWWIEAEAEIPPGSQLFTPEDIEAGWRVLTPEQARTVLRQLTICRDQRDFDVQGDMDKALALLAGVPGKDSDT